MPHVFDSSKLIFHAGSGEAVTYVEGTETWETTISNGTVADTFKIEVQKTKNGHVNNGVGYTVDVAAGAFKDAAGKQQQRRVQERPEACRYCG